MSRFIIIPHRVLSDARFTSMTPLRVLMALGNRTDKNGWAFVKRKTLAESVGVSRARISQCIADLRAWGYIEVIAQERSGGGGQTCNRYRVLYDVGGPEQLDEIDDEDGNGPTPGVSVPDPPVSDANTPVSHKKLTPRLAALTPGLVPYDLPPGKSRGFTPVVNDVVVNDKSSSNACARDPVDNSDAAAAAFLGTQNPNLEHELTELLIALEAARRKRCRVNRSSDRAHVLAWARRGFTADQLLEAHCRAVAARERDIDSRAVNVGFLARFVDEVLAEAPSARSGASRDEWWLGGEADVCREAARLGVRPKDPDECLPEYRVLVAKAAGKGPWIDHVLKDAQRSGSERFYRNVLDIFGDALLPADFHA